MRFCSEINSVVTPEDKEKEITHATSYSLGMLLPKNFFINR